MDGGTGERADLEARSDGGTSGAHRRLLREQCWYGASVVVAEAANLLTRDAEPEILGPQVGPLSLCDNAVLHALSKTGSWLGAGLRISHPLAVDGTLAECSRRAGHPWAGATGLYSLGG